MKRMRLSMYARAFALNRLTITIYESLRFTNPVSLVTLTRERNHIMDIKRIQAGYYEATHNGIKYIIDHETDSPYGSTWWVYIEGDQECKADFYTYRDAKEYIANI